MGEAGGQIEILFGFWSLFLDLPSSLFTDSFLFKGLVAWFLVPLLVALLLYDLQLGLQVLEFGISLLFCNVLLKLIWLLMEGTAARREGL